MAISETKTTVECPYTLQWDAHSPSKICPFPLGGSEPPSNTWSLGPTQVLNPNGISIGSAIFAGLTSVTERQTDRLTDHATQSLRPMTHVPETGTENRYRKNGTGFRRVCHAIWYRIFLVPDSCNG